MVPMTGDLYELPAAGRIRTWQLPAESEDHRRRGSAASPEPQVSESSSANDDPRHDLKDLGGDPQPRG